MEPNNNAGAAGADEAAARAAADETDRQNRIQQAADDAREDAQAAADAAAKNAADLADAAAAAAEDDGLVEVTIPQPGVTIRMNGSVQHFTPGTKRVPRELANALGASPTFATSGDPVADRAVRRTLERDGVVEMASQESTTAMHTSMRGETAEEGADAELPSGDAQKGPNARVKPDRTGKQAATLTELRELGAEEVEKRYTKGVRAGRVKAVKDGKGSGADGAVVTDDRVQALHDAGEKV